jgi:hypothetical protein
MNEGQSYAAMIWRWGYVLWVCRVAVASAAAGLALLAYTAQARDLFADLALVWWQWMFFLALVFAWAWIVHGSARHALQHDDWVPEASTGAMTPARRFDLQTLFWVPALWIPRALSLVIFFSVGFAVWRTTHNLGPAADGLPEAAQAVTLAYILIAATVVVALLYVWSIWKRRRLGDWQQAGGGWSQDPPLLAGTGPVFAKYLGYARVTPPVPGQLVDWLLYATRVLVLLFLVVTIVEPHLFASNVARLFFVPVLLGGAVVLLGEVGAWSLRWHTPLLLMICVVSLVCVYLTKSFHDTRWIETKVQPSKAAGLTQQIKLSEAVDRWKVANKCAGAAPQTCPRPILIAGAGGASRAGFFTATVVGALIDLGLDQTKGAPYGDIRSRIFALSTVSGSSAGAAVMRAALLDAVARNEPNTPPCKTGGTGSWFGQPLMAADKSIDPKKNWRDCFQAILAGDFLSPIFVALAYRDNFPFINPLTGTPAWSDRAVLLEQALEQRYHRFTAEGGESVSCPDQPPKTGSDGMCRPFGYHPDTTASGAWVPIFFINGTSVFTGRRIIVGDVATTDDYGDGRTFMPLAYDLNDVRDPKIKGKPMTEKGGDIRLSTAATMSARFPIISPQGLLRTVYGDVNDQVVDGGYFENDGLATISDLAEALTGSFKLDPVVIRIVNAPAAPEDPAADKTRPPPPVAEERTFFDDAFAIARALVASGSGHEDQYATSLKSKLKNESRFYEIGVYEFAPPNGNASAAQRSMSPQANPVCRREVKSKAKMEQVSMSWWMSQPVQAYLDAQLCLPANWLRIECELREGRAGRGGECARTPQRTAG